MPVRTGDDEARRDSAGPAATRPRRGDALRLAGLVPLRFDRVIPYLAAGLVPWVVYLGFVLPSATVAEHWRLAWVGFDLVLGLALASTAAALHRRSPAALMLTTGCGTLLLVDAWFDVLTAHAPGDRLEAVLLALAVEIPLAVVFFVTALRLRRVAASAQAELLKLGYAVVDGKLVPPSREGSVEELSG